MRATAQDLATIRENGYTVSQWGKHGWTLTDPDDDYLMIGSQGCCATTLWEAVAEGMVRIARG